MPPPSRPLYPFYQMTTKTFLFLAGLLVVLSANAQLTKIFETKTQAKPVIAFYRDNSQMVQAGSNLFEAISLENGDVQMRKQYKESGASFETAFDAVVDSSGQYLVVCDKTKTVACFDFKSGALLWENQDFVDLGSDKNNKSLACGNGVIVVTDKKGKNNYRITCLDAKTGKAKWSVGNEADKVNADDVYIHPNHVRVPVYFKRTDKTLVRFFNIETGKQEITAELDGFPIYTLNVADEYTYTHHRISDKKSFLSAIDLKNNKLLWTSACINESPNLPMVMNIEKIRHYAVIKAAANKVLLITEGIEAFDAANGKSLFNIPFVPYYKWGVGHYINAIFTPEVTDKGILLADGSGGDLIIRYYDLKNGNLIWSGEVPKKAHAAPRAYVKGNQAIVQFGGVCDFEVMNRSEIGKFIDPYAVKAYDLATGKVVWSMESKKDIYGTEMLRNEVLIIGKSDLQYVNLKTGSLDKTEKNPFDESYFMTQVGLNVTKFQKDVSIDFEGRTVIRNKDNKLIKSRF